MRYYDICQDKTVDLPLWQYAWRRLLELRHRIIWRGWFSVALVFGAICQRCLHKASSRLHERASRRDREKFLRRLKKADPTRYARWFPNA